MQFSTGCSWKSSCDWTTSLQASFRHEGAETLVFSLLSEKKLLQQHGAVTTFCFANEILIVLRQIPLFGSLMRNTLTAIRIPLKTVAPLGVRVVCALAVNHSASSSLRGSFATGPKDQAWLQGQWGQKV